MLFNLVVSSSNNDCNWFCSVSKKWWVKNNYHGVMFFNEIAAYKVHWVKPIILLNRQSPYPWLKRLAVKSQGENIHEQRLFMYRDFQFIRHSYLVKLCNLDKIYLLCSKYWDSEIYSISINNTSKYRLQFAIEIFYSKWTANVVFWSDAFV